EGVEREVASSQHQRHERDPGEDADLDQIAGGDAQDVAEQDVAEVGVAGRDRDQHQAEREQGGEDDPDRGVLLDPAGPADGPDERDGEHPEDDRPDREGHPDDVGEHHAGQHGVRDRIAHQRPAHQHEPAGQQRAHDRRGDRRGERPHHELVLQGFEEEIDRAHRRASPRAMGSRRYARPSICGASASATSPWNRTRRRSRIAESASWGRACRSWLETSTVQPAAASSRSRSTIVASLRLSTPANGSSSSRMEAPCARPRATNARLRWPPESCPICRPARSVSPTRSSAPATASWSARRGRRVRPWCPYRPIITTSRTQTGKDQSTSSLCGTYPTRPRRRARAGSLPSIRTPPALGATMPMMALNRVDFPEPFIPMSPVTSPERMRRSTSSTAVTEPYRTVRPLTSMLTPPPPDRSGPSR